MSWRGAEAIFERMAASQPSAVDEALSYLENDPWDYRTGYAKANLMRRLKQAPLSATELERLERILLHYVDVGQRWEFREACQLARRLNSVSFRDELAVRLQSEDILHARRAMSMLLRLTRPRLRPSDRASVRTLLLKAAALPDQEVGRVRPGQARAVWAAEWGEELVRTSRNAQGADSLAAQRLLAAVPGAAARLQ